jgi:hypothetical protein
MAAGEAWTRSPIHEDVIARAVSAPHRIRREAGHAE